MKALHKAFSLIAKQLPNNSKIISSGCVQHLSVIPPKVFDQQYCNYFTTPIHRNSDDGIPSNGTTKGENESSREISLDTLMTKIQLKGCDQVIEKNSNKVATLSEDEKRELWKALYTRGYHTKSIDDVNRAIELYPEEAIAYFIRAQLWEEQEQFQKALEDYTKSLNYQDPIPDALYNKFKVYINLFPNYQERIVNELTEYSEKTDFPQLYQVLIELGLCYTHFEQFKNYELALKAYQKALDIVVKDKNLLQVVQILRLMGGLYEKIQNDQFSNYCVYATELLERHFPECKTECPTKVVTFYITSGIRLMESSDKRQQGLVTLLQAISMSEEFVYPYICLANYFLFAEGNIDKAKHYISKAKTLIEGKSQKDTINDSIHVTYYLVLACLPGTEQEFNIYKLIEHVKRELDNKNVEKEQCYQLLERLWNVSVDQKNFEPTLLIAEKMLELGFIDFNVMMLKVTSMLLLKQHEEAVNLCNELLKEYTDKQQQGLVLNARGVAYFHMKQYDLARKDFKKSIELSPDSEVVLKRGLWPNYPNDPEE